MVGWLVDCLIEADRRLAGSILVLLVRRVGSLPILFIAYRSSPALLILHPRHTAAPESVRLSLDDVSIVVCDVFRCRCALTGCRLHDPGRRQFTLCRWDSARDATVDNVLFATVDAAASHEREGIAALPPEQVRQVEETIRLALGGRSPTAFERALAREGLPR